MARSWNLRYTGAKLVLALNEAMSTAASFSEALSAGIRAFRGGSPMGRPLDVLRDPEAKILVRRLAAMEGEELESKAPEIPPYVLAKGECWVLGDNETLPLSEMIDSRSVGPLPVSSILGRVVYAAESLTSHAPVENSVEGMAADAPILDAELDIERLCDDGGERGGSST